MRSSASWWASKARQFRAHLRASVAPGERAALAAWITPAPARSCSTRCMSPTGATGSTWSRRCARRASTEPDVLVAGLLHDAGQGRHGRLAAGRLHARASATAPGSGGVARRPARVRGPRSSGCATHAETSAVLAAAAGCSPRTVELIRHQDAPIDPEFGELLRLADEAN